MADYVRGSTITFIATCTNSAGDAISPASATLHLVYQGTDGALTKQDVTMVVADSTVTAEWDSSVAGAGVVRWSIRAVGASKIVKDGEFTLTGNDANSVA